MIIVEPQAVEIGDSVPYGDKQLIVKDLYTDGTALRMQDPKYIMSHKRGYFLLEEANGI